MDSRCIFNHFYQGRIRESRIRSRESVSGGGSDSGSDGGGGGGGGGAIRYTYRIRQPSYVCISLSRRRDLDR